jgi:hypothetical protein
MTQPTICHSCVRRDPFTVLDWICMPNGVFQTECMLRERNFGTLGSTEENPSIGTVSRFGGFGSLLANAGGAWKGVAAVVAMIAAALGGYSFKGIGPSSDGSQRISQQLELAQSCLNDGILDCAAHLVEPIARADPDNVQAKKIEEAVKKQQASLIQHPSASNQQEKEVFLTLAGAIIDFGRDCLAERKLSCATGISDLVLKIVPPGFDAGQQVRAEAQTLNEMAHLRR